MVRAIAARILRQILLVIVGAEPVLAWETTELRRRWHSTGRLSVDVAADPPVDQHVIRMKSLHIKQYSFRRHIRIIVEIARGILWRPY
jgi:hypothetical protein